MALNLTKNDLVDSAVLIAVTGFLLSYFHPEYLLSATVTTGGDTASHYHAAEYMKNYLLPKGKIAGWTQGNYAGYPLFQYYFPFPFVLMAALSFIIPLPIAFKLVSVLGIFLLPLCTYLCLRLLKCSFPVPIFGAIFTLPFLFMEANSMWGGNIPSTLSGEFPFSIGLALSVLFIGTLWNGISSGNHAVKNAILLAVIGFCSGYTLLFSGAASLFFLFTKENFAEKIKYIIKVNLLAFMFMGLWIVPLLYYTPFTTRFNFVWWIDSLSQVFPPILLPLVGIVLAGLAEKAFSNRYALRLRIFQRFFKKKGGTFQPLENTKPISDSEAIAQFVSRIRLLAGRVKPWSSQIWRFEDVFFNILAGVDNRIDCYLWFCVIVSIFLYLIAYRINVIDARFLPALQIVLCLIAAVEAGRFTKALKLIRVLPIILCITVFLWTDHNVKYIESWIAWNYSGFENKPLWPQFSAINNYLRGDTSSPRVVYENSHLQEAAGTIRAFESLPLFSGRSTLEGLDMQSTPASPFVFYIQSEISEDVSCPLPEYGCSTLNLGKAIKHLTMFNVKDFIIRSDILKNEIRKHPEFTFKKEVAPYEIYELSTNENRYVTPLRYEPVLYVTKNWKVLAYKWFKNERINDVHIAFTEEPSEADRKLFKTVIKSDDLEPLPMKPLNNQCSVKEDIQNEAINIKTDCLHKPLLVKISYHPRWKVEGAEKIYLASPSFMLIFPEKENVTMKFSNTWVENTGSAMTITALLIAILSLPMFRQHLLSPGLRSGGKIILNKLDSGLRITVLLNFLDNNKKRALSIIAGISLILLFFTVGKDSQSIFSKGMKLYNEHNYPAARTLFTEVIAKQPVSMIGIDSSFYYAACYYFEGKYQKSVEAFRKLIKEFPDSYWIGEAYYNIGISYAGMKDNIRAKETLNFFISNYSKSHLVSHAIEKLAEIEADGAAR